MQDTKRIWALVGAAIVIVALVVEVVWQRGPSIPKPTTPVVTYAAKGELVSQFPKQLILENKSAVQKSYAISYASGTTQYTAVLDSTSSVWSVYVDYLKYLPPHHFVIKTSQLATSSGLYAISTSSVVSISINASSTGSETILTYLQH
jgi:hypothetical protein